MFYVTSACFRISGTEAWVAGTFRGTCNASSKHKSPFLPTTVIYHAKLPVVRDGVHGGEKQRSKRCSASLSDISLIV